VKMRTTGGDETPGLNFLVDPFEGKILVFGDSGDCTEFEDLDDLRDYCSRLLEGANRLETRLLIGEKKAPVKSIFPGVIPVRRSRNGKS